MNKIHQFLFNKENERLNENILEVSGKKYFPVIKLGIQAPPGIRFTINGGGKIEIGAYGIYELDLSGGLGKITDITFSDEKLLGESEKILVDIVYEGGLDL